MRCIVEYKVDHYPPLLRLYIHGAPHRRQHTAVIRRYRDELVAAGRAAGLRLPIQDPIDLTVTFINPCSPDLDNLVTALYRALDGTSHDSATLLEDDSQIQGVTMHKYYPNDSTRADRPNRRERAPKKGVIGTIVVKPSRHPDSPVMKAVRQQVSQELDSLRRLGSVDREEA